MKSKKLEKLIQGLKDGCSTGDPECDHANADSLLLEYINNKEVEEAYNAVKKWYA